MSEVFVKDARATAKELSARGRNYLEQVLDAMSEYPEEKRWERLVGFLRARFSRATVIVVMNTLEKPGIIKDLRGKVRADFVEYLLLLSVKYGKLLPPKESLALNSLKTELIRDNDGDYAVRVVANTADGVRHVWEVGIGGHFQSIAGLLGPFDELPNLSEVIEDAMPEHLAAIARIALEVQSCKSGKEQGKS